jgi:hypothetical protein
MSSPEAFERRRDLRRLRREHNRAVDDFRYADAARLQYAIDRIVSDPEACRWRRCAADRARAIRSQADRKRGAYARERERILDCYRPRLAALTARQDAELAALGQERARALEREATRPIPEVDHLLMRSRVFARDHQYEYAGEVYREALRRRDAAVRERTAACRATFRDQKRHMAARHARELAVLDDGITAALEKLDREYGDEMRIIGHRHRINEFRNGVWPPSEYSLGPFHRRLDPAESFLGRPQSAADASEQAAGG